MGMSNEQENLKRQLQFYFSHANYNKDIFLKQECEKPISDSDKNFRGIPIETLLIFKKLKEMKVNESDIIEILKNESLQNIIELREENEKKYLRKKDLEDYEIYKNKVKENPNAFVIRIK